MLYMACVAILFCWRFYSAKRAAEKRVKGAAEHQEKLDKLAAEIKEA